ncbi:cytochrome P450 [Desarmillaria tabescens]|uniref:Cytochrome P450 n=1 Tax=Armillaria tabescens TaxID=1929756 RepID=A0AA39MX89_ARMTA|nr:cytochrome P450 [Desarmillaria tabescens]KAK0449598.1 cytochrome P450 [Desarmillaria tabescens]
MCTIQVLSASIVLLAATVLLQRFLRGYSVVSKLPVAPSEEASILWGHEYKVAKGEVSAEYTRWAALLGQVFRIKAALFQGDRVIVADSVVAQHIFQNAYIYLNSQTFEPIVVKVVGRGVAWAEGEEHKFQRRLLYATTSYRLSAVKGLADDVLQCAEKCASRLASDLETQENINAGVFNLSLYIPAYAFETICRVVFGRDFGYENSDAQAILGSWREDVQKFATFLAFLAPRLIGIFPWIARLPIAAFQEDGFAKKVIQRVAGELLKQPSNPDGRDIFSILVRESWEGKEISGEKLSNQQLIDNITTLLMAGFEASSGVVVFTLLDLAQNMEAQTRLREELLGAELDPKTIDNLQYLDAVTRESLRLHPSSAETHRIAVCDDTIPLHKPVTLQTGEIITALPVRAGDQFTIPYTLLNTNPVIWGPNAQEFVPERWMAPDGVPPSKELPHGPWSNLSTFSDGPRMCIGWRLAVMQVKTFLAVMVRTFEFKDSGVKVDKMMSPSLQPFVNGKAAVHPIRISPVHSSTY